MERPLSNPTTPTASSQVAPSQRALLGLGATALAVFLTEMALMRAVAQVTWPPFAFVALSAAMLGGGLSGTVLALKPDFCLRDDGPARGALIVAISSPLAMFGALLGGLEPFEIASPGGAARFLFVLILLALPFVGLAWTLAALLERHHERAHAAYGADLVGAAVGAFLSVFVLNAVGTAGAAYLACALGGVAALLLAPADRRLLQAGAAGSLVIGVGLVLAAPNIIPHATAGKRVGNRPATEVLQRLAKAGRLQTFDRADGRVDVIPAKPSPVMLLDLGAAVARAPSDGPLEKGFVDAASASFVARSPEGGRTLVLGSGAGFEVARALSHGATHVDAVEFSGAVVQAATSGAIKQSARLFADPRVKMHHAEARSFLERQKARWRHIVAVHTISNTAVAASAMQLAEDFLLTVESFEALVGHLTDDGVLYVTRPKAQIALLADVARAALISSGKNPWDVDKHLVLVKPTRPDPFFRGLLIFREPVDDSLRSGLIAAPAGLTFAPPPPATTHALPTDARPFFHRLSEDVDRDARARLQIEGPRIAERAVLWVGALSLLAAILAIAVPLWARRGPQSLPRPAPAHLAIAALLGVGFMVLELALAQRLTLICGTPATAFAAVVGGMLLGGGVAGLAVAKRPPRLWMALVLAVLGCLCALVLPPVFRGVGVLALPEVWRATLVALGAAVCAAPLGLVFPALVQASAKNVPASAPWLFAVNASASVGAAALHAAVAPTVGLWGTTLLAAVCYAVAFILVKAAPKDAEADVQQGLRLVADADCPKKSDRRANA